MSSSQRIFPSGSLVKRMVPADVVISAFANRKLNLVLANYNKHPVQVVTRDRYIAAGEESAPAKTNWSLGPRSLVILHRSVG